jgi:hypothetical protein
MPGITHDAGRQVLLMAGASDRCPIVQGELALQSAMMNLRFMLLAPTLSLGVLLGGACAPGEELPPLACSAASAQTESQKLVFAVRVQDLMAQPLSCDGRAVHVEGFFVKSRGSNGMLFASRSSAVEASARWTEGERPLRFVWLRLGFPAGETTSTYFNGLHVKVQGTFTAGSLAGRRQAARTEGSVRTSRMDIIDPTEPTPPASFLVELQRLLPSHPPPPPPPPPRPRTQFLSDPTTHEW